MNKEKRQKGKMKKRQWLTIRQRQATESYVHI